MRLKNVCITKIIGNYLRILTLLIRFDDVIIAQQIQFVKKFFILYVSSKGKVRNMNYVVFISQCLFCC